MDLEDLAWSMLPVFVDTNVTAADTRSFFVFGL
jgi:hypothetical protein